MSWSTRLAFFFVLAFLLFSFSTGYAAQWKAILGGKSQGPTLPPLPTLGPTLGSPVIN